MTTFAIATLGCKVNTYESQGYESALLEKGYEQVSFKEKADVYIINTCAVTNTAGSKSRQKIHAAIALNPEALIAVVGCYAQTASEQLEQDANIDILLGSDGKSRLADMIEEGLRKKRPQKLIHDVRKVNVFEALPIHRFEHQTRAFLKIQDGCNQFCSYCIIPYTRGRIRSRRPGDVIKEVEKLAASGYREVVLTGIHLSSYGVDFREDKKSGLFELIGRLNEIQGLERIRLGSLEPRIITEESAAFLASIPKFCPHFHLSLQSGCDSVLKRMNRHYTTEEYYEKCEILRRYFHNPAITTDVIVGFPGETEEEFEATRQFLEKVHFYEMHVFKYSRRKGTVADRMEGQIPEPVKGERSDVLLELDRSMSQEYRTLFLGKELEILLEEEVMIEGDRYLVGHTKEYVRCAVDLEAGEKGTLVTGKGTAIMEDGTLLLKRQIG